LQQLGRGLRLHRGKECLTVLDFIGKQHDHFALITASGRSRTRQRLMLGAALLGPSGPQILDKWLGALKEHPALRGEMLDLLGSLAGEAPRLPRPFTALHGVPLSLHCRYLLAEVMAAFGSVSANGQRVIVPQTGVYLDKPTRAELLFVTLQKSARHYSPSTMYEDYAISPTEFHWQSQNHV